LFQSISVILSNIFNNKNTLKNHRTFMCWHLLLMLEFTESTPILGDISGI